MGVGSRYDLRNWALDIGPIRDLRTGRTPIMRHLFLRPAVRFRACCRVSHVRTKAVPASAADIGPAPELRADVVENASSAYPGNIGRMAARAIDLHILLFGRSPNSFSLMERPLGPPLRSSASSSGGTAGRIPRITATLVNLRWRVRNGLCRVYAPVHGHT